MLGGVAREDRGENEDRNFSRAGLKNRSMRRLMISQTSQTYSREKVEIDG